MVARLGRAAVGLGSLEAAVAHVDLGEDDAFLEVDPVGIVARDGDEEIVAHHQGGPQFAFLRVVGGEGAAERPSVDGLERHFRAGGHVVVFESEVQVRGALGGDPHTPAEAAVFVTVPEAVVAGGDETLMGLGEPVGEALLVAKSIVFREPVEVQRCDFMHRHDVEAGVVVGRRRGAQGTCRDDERRGYGLRSVKHCDDLSSFRYGMVRPIPIIQDKCIPGHGYLEL